MTKHQTLIRIVFSFLLCTAFLGIIVRVGAGYRPIGALLFGSFSFMTLMLPGPIGIILISSFGRARLYKRVGFWLGWTPLCALVVIGNLATEDWITHLSTIPFLVSSTISVIIRLREKDGT